VKSGKKTVAFFSQNRASFFFAADASFHAEMIGGCERRNRLWRKMVADFCSKTLK
jgi:hypothetical protein